MSDLRCTAVLLAAGKGTRMGAGVPKQYMDLCGRPLITYALETLSKSPEITDLVLVIPKGDESYIRKHILPLVPEAEEKLRCFAFGGTERYHSVANGIEKITWPCSYVFIHDGARPFLDEKTIKRLYEAVLKEEAVVAGMPSKDTVKITDASGYVKQTPDRSNVWIIQTPQVFSYPLIRDAYRALEKRLAEPSFGCLHVTDDAMVVEEIAHHRVKLIEASYRNIKVTTPEDIAAAEAFLTKAGRESPAVKLSEGGEELPDE